MNETYKRKVLTFPMFQVKGFTFMGKQYNKEIKKRRRQAYLKRKKTEQPKKK